MHLDRDVDNHVCSLPLHLDTRLTLIQQAVILVIKLSLSVHVFTRYI